MEASISRIRSRHAWSPCSRSFWAAPIHWVSVESCAWGMDCDARRDIAVANPVVIKFRRSTPYLGCEIHFVNEARTPPFGFSLSCCDYAPNFWDSTLTPRDRRFRARQFRHQKLHHGPCVFPAPFEAVVGALQGSQSCQQAWPRYFPRALQRQLSLLRTHSQRAGGLPAVRNAFHFAGFDQFAKHPRNRAKHLQRFFPRAQQAIQEFQCFLRLPRRQ